MPTKPPVLVAAPHLPPFCLDLLHERFDVHRVNAADRSNNLPEGPVALICTVDIRIDAELIGRLPRSLCSIATYSVGLDHIDQDAARARGLAIVNAPGTLAASVAEAALFLLLGAARRGRESLDLLASGSWSGWRADQLLGQSVENRCLGILGMGEIGLEIAHRAKAFGMNVIYHNRSARHGVPPEIRYVANTDLFLEQCDVLVLACPLTPQTRNFLNADRIAKLPRQAIVVNVARGEVVDDDALIAALRSGQVSAAGLDVFAGEPKLRDEYRQLPNVFATPHIGSSTLQARRAMMEKVIAGVLQHLTLDRSS